MLVKVLILFNNTIFSYFYLKNHYISLSHSVYDNKVLSQLIKPTVPLNKFICLLVLIQ